jgi:peptide/nickel transport system substrate-binding protein
VGISQDGKTYTFFIRPNAVWHDGQPVTSDDIAFTVDLMKDEKIPLPADLHTFWKQVKVFLLDEKNLQLILPEPFAPFLDYLSFGVLPKQILEGVSAEELIDSPFNLNPVGSGPYRFAGVEVADEKVAAVALTAFDDYYGEKPFIADLISLLPGCKHSFSRLRSGEIRLESTA